MVAKKNTVKKGPRKKEVTINTGSNKKPQVVGGPDDGAEVSDRRTLKALRREIVKGLLADGCVKEEEIVEKLKAEHGIETSKQTIYLDKKALGFKSKGKRGRKPGSKNKAPAGSAKRSPKRQARTASDNLGAFVAAADFIEIMGGVDNAIAALQAARRLHGSN